MMRYLIGLVLLLTFTRCNTAYCGIYGNVTVELTQEGELRIYGDRENNYCVLLFRDGEAIVHVPYVTTLNGTNDDFVVPTASVKSVDVILGDGDDWFRLGVLDIVQANISIDTGPGRDYIWPGGDGRNVGTRNPAASICGNLSINSGKDGDFVVVEALTVLGETSISTGHGSDEIRIGAYNIEDFDTNTGIGIPCEFVSGLKINSGLDNDELSFFIDTFTIDSDDMLAASVDGNLEIQLGQGDDSLNWLSDPCFVTVSGDALIDGGQGDDLAESLDQILVEGAYDVSGFE